MNASSSAIPIVSSWDGYVWVSRPGTDDWLAVTAFHEPFMMGLLNNLSSGQDTVFVDAGAHTGRYAIRLAKRVKRVYALEPMPQTFEALLMNIQLNQLQDKVVPMMVAASDARETISAQWQGKTHSFQADRLDSLLPEPPDLLLIDVEGAEEKVLRGLGSMTPHHMVIEVHDRVYPGKVDVPAIQRLLAEKRYAVSEVGWWGFPPWAASRYFLATLI